MLCSPRPSFVILAVMGGDRRQSSFAGLAGRLAIARKPVDQTLDWLRFRVDTFPWTYHPTGNGARSARRGDGTASRWNAIRSFVHELDIATAVDIGCNGGWFVLRLAEMGVVTIGVDSDPRFSRMLLYESERGKHSNIGVLTMRVDMHTAAVLPAADCILFLSVWHHLMKEAGPDRTNRVLQALWAKTNKVLFFDTGEREMPPAFGLPPMSPDPETWLRAYLSRTCPNADVRHLGTHGAFAPDGTICRRNLFAVVRDRVGASAPSSAP
jgi:SAM-dependent methyltransferase